MKILDAIRAWFARRNRTPMMRKVTVDGQPAMAWRFTGHDDPFPHDWLANYGVTTRPCGEHGEELRVDPDGLAMTYDFEAGRWERFAAPFGFLAPGDWMIFASPSFLFLTDPQFRDQFPEVFVPSDIEPGCGVDEPWDDEFGRSFYRPGEATF